MSSRSAILARLRRAREAAADGLAPSASGTAPDVAAWYGAAPDLPRGDRIAALKGAFEAVQGEVHVAGPDHWAPLLAGLLARRGVRHLLWDPATDAARALAGHLDPALRLEAFDRSIEDWKPTLFDRVDAGFTVADCAIAATGTLVLRASPGQPRTLSLVPPLHIALIHADRIYPRLIDAATGEGWAADMPSNLILISGPSKTSDIQQTTAYGAHGPRALIVLVIDPEARP